MESHNFLLRPSAYSYSKMAEVSEGEGLRERYLLSLLEKLHLGHLFENFQRGKVTVDQICKLSDKQIECLGVNYRNTTMTLMLKCLTFGSDPPPRKPGAQGCGAPGYFICKSVLEAYPQDGFTIKYTAS